MALPEQDHLPAGRSLERTRLSGGLLQLHAALLTAPPAVGPPAGYRPDGQAGRRADLQARHPDRDDKIPIDADQAERRAEERLQAILEAWRFPLPPQTQYRVDLGAGHYTVANLAYPAHKALVFIDGMWGRLHGDLERRRKDRLKRAQARMQGLHVVEISAEGLKDEAALALVLDELAVYLGHVG